MVPRPFHRPGYPPAYRPLVPRISRPVQKRLPTRKAMTIAVGMIANGGIVLAADTQLTDGLHNKSKGGKIMAAGRGGKAVAHTGACAVTGATNNFDLLHGLGDEVWKDFLETIDDADKDAAFERFEDIVYGFFSRHIVPEPALDVSILIGYQRDGAMALWQSSRGLLVEQYDYGAVGIGASAALGWLRKIWRGPMDIATSVLAATFAVGAAKESVEGCGKHTHVLVIEADSFRRIYQGLVNEIDALYEALSEQVQPDFLHRCFGENPHTRGITPDEFVEQSQALIKKIKDKTPESVRHWRRLRWERLRALAGQQS